jgi:hypothetical protein
MDPPPEVLQEIGRITVKGADLEAAMAAMLAHLTGRDFDDTAQLNGDTLAKELRKAASDRPAGDSKAILAWVARARELLEKRHLLVHSFSVLIPPIEFGDGWLKTAMHPRSGSFQNYDVPTMYQFALALGGCAVKGYELSNRLPSPSA